MKKRLTVGVLGMPDNQNTRELLAHLDAESVPFDFVIYWKPSFRANLRRLRRKLRGAGVGPTLQRVRYATFSKQKGHESGSPKTRKSHREYFVPSHNSAECRQILSHEAPDCLLLATDAIVGKATLRIPRLAVLNAHPGWLPTYRGLGSQLYQMEDGWLPAATIHSVDEGIDTGPVILREQVMVEPTTGIDGIETQVQKHRLQLLTRVIGMFEQGGVRYIDTFAEPSGMTRGMQLGRRRKLDVDLRSGRLALRPFPETEVTPG